MRIEVGLGKKTTAEELRDGTRMMSFEQIVPMYALGTQGGAA